MIRHDMFQLQHHKNSPESRVTDLWGKALTLPVRPHSREERAGRQPHGPVYEVGRWVGEVGG